MGNILNRFFSIFINTFMTYSKLLSAISNSTGTTWTAFSSVAPITELLVINDTGTTMSFRKSFDTSVSIPIKDAKFFLFEGINNANQIEFRRTDTSNTQVTLYADAINRQ